MRQPTKPLDGDLGRKTTIADVEAAIASRWWRKDRRLQIIGIPKKAVGTFYGKRVFIVDGEWIRDNLDTTFGTGGHGLVHCFIPLEEVWIDPVVEQPSSLIFHEIAEHHYMMRDGNTYATAHERALDAQKGRQVSLGSIEVHLKEAFSG